MQISAILVAALGATSVTSCYFGGAKWGDKSKAKDLLREQCKKLAGDFRPGEYRRYCVNESGKKYIFRIENNSGRGINLTRDECLRNVGSRIDDCAHGGTITLGGVKYMYASSQSFDAHTQVSLLISCYF